MPQIPVQGKAGLPTSLVVSGRTVPVILPNAYNGRTKKYRLGIFLHSYGGNATSTLNRYFASSSEAANFGQGMVCLLPSGLLDNLNNPYWNASDPCCANDAYLPAADVTFLTALVTLAMQTYSIDPREVIVFGYSNGAIMAYTLALCASNLVTAIYSFAGFCALPGDSKYCAGTGKVHVTQVSPMADLVVVPDGDATGAILTDKPVGVYASRLQSVDAFKVRNGCTGSLTQYDSKDLTAATAGNETNRFSYPGQAVDGSVELWEVTGALADHNVGMNTNFYRAIELRQYGCRRMS